MLAARELNCRAASEGSPAFDDDLDSILGTGQHPPVGGACLRRSWSRRSPAAFAHGAGLCWFEQTWHGVVWQAAFLVGKVVDEICSVVVVLAHDHAAGDQRPSARVIGKPARPELPAAPDDRVGGGNDGNFAHAS